MKKIVIRNIFYGILFMMVIWLLDSVADHYFSYPDEGFMDVLLFDVPVKELYMRIILILLFLGVSVAYFLLSGRLKVTRKQLLESREKYKLLAENVNDVIWTMDVNNRFTYVSPSVKRLRGYTPEEVMQVGLEHSLTPASLRVVNDLMTRLQEYLQENPGRIPSLLTELEQTCKDGSTVWTETSVSIIFDDQKKPSLLIGVSRNINDRKAKENEIRRSENNYRQLADCSHDYIILHNLDGFISYMNPSALRNFGYTPDEVVGMKFIDLVPEKYHSQVADIIQLRQKDGKSEILSEMEIFSQNKTRIPVEITSSSVFLNGKISSVLITARDIRARLEARKLSQKNEKRYRHYIEHSPIPIISINRNNRINYMNPAASDYLSYSMGEMGEMEILDFVHDKSKHEFCRILQNPGERSFSFKTSFKDKKGNELVALVSGGLTEEKELLLYLVDFTCRNEAEKRARDSEKKLREMNANLEFLVRQRTDELIVANKELESFSYSVSHDLQSPLRHISFFSDKLDSGVKESDNGKIMANLGQIKASVQNMKDLINHLLEFSRLGRAAIELSEFPMEEPVREIFEDALKIERSDLNIITGDLGIVKADKYLIKQVWQNLISNAIKFSSREAKPEIRISRYNENGSVWFSIEDNGVGFNPDYSDKLFTVFQRLHSVSEFEGIGIGLPVVKRIVEKHGGRIYGESRPGVGAKFSFSLDSE